MYHFSDASVWTSSLSEVNVASFEEEVGPAVPLAPNISVLGLFQMFMTPMLVASIVEQTNQYAHLVLGDARPWREITPEDIWAFYGFCILMGINHLPALHHYWSTDPIFHYSPIAERISRDRFLAIWRFLHFTDAPPPPTTSSPPDRLYKVRPVITAVLRPHREQAVDEAMIAFKGRSSMKQYLPMKPVKRGFKVWVRADNHNSYICQFECYTGRKGDTTEVGLGGSVVTRLTRDLVGKNHHIFMDSFFSSVPLYHSLLSDSIYCTGTIRTNRRGFPPDLKVMAKKGLAKRGDFDVRQDGNVCVTVWQDSRPVTFMSSGHNPDHTKVIQRKKHDGSVVDVDCPVCVVDYNQFMGGVDTRDQYRQYYHVRVKSRKSYKYIFWFLFENCVFNAFILSKYTACTHNKSYLSFRQQLAHELIGDYNTRIRRSISHTVIHHNLVCNAQHYPSNLGRNKRGWCKLYGCHRQTVWYCVTCDMRLCHMGKEDDCFAKHHARHHLFSPSSSSS